MAETQMINVTIERGGERLETQVPEGSTIQVLIDNGHLRGITAASPRLNGEAATSQTPLQNGDSVSQVPKSGKQG